MALDIPETWQPAAAAINALPNPLVAHHHVERLVLELGECFVAAAARHDAIASCFEDPLVILSTLASSSTSSTDARSVATNASAVTIPRT